MKQLTQDKGAKNLNLDFSAIVLLVLALVVTMTIGLTQNLAYAATILCAGVVAPAFCVGTDSGDTMLGDGQTNAISGKGGGDVIYGLGNPALPDVICGGNGDDEASINTSVGGDVALNCETVHAG